MSNAQQIQKGSSRNLISKKGNKFQKKLHHRALRYWAKKMDNPHPLSNRYCGGWEL